MGWQPQMRMARGIKRDVPKVCGDWGKKDGNLKPDESAGNEV